MAERPDAISSDDATLAGPPLSADVSGDATLLVDPSAGGAAGPAPRTIAELLEAKRLGHYILLGELGRGGMGVVLSAYDETLDRKVAIKVLQSGGRADAQRRLVREAQALARLSHPNVVQIYEIGELPGPAPLAFIVMEFIDGHTLEAWRDVSEGARSRSEILEVFMAAGRGLAAAHAKGLVHRDFKPENVMVRKDGRVVVMDFGLAREGLAAAEPSGEVRLPVDALKPGSNELSVDMTATGALMGTPAYMSPEQFKGEATDAKTDQFSFCVALWEALFDERPFSAPTIPALSLAVTRGELRSPERGDLPGWLMRVLQRGLAVDPGDRWPSMDALLDALAADPTRRRRAWIAGLATLGTIAAVLVGARVVESRAEAEQSVACAGEGQVIAQAWNPSIHAELDARFADAPAVASWTRAAAWMDAYARDWARLREGVCIEAKIEATRELENYAKVSACLDDARVAAEATIEVWTTADPRIVAHAATAATSLTPIAACDDATWLDQRVAPPDDPDARAEVARLRGELERVAALTHVAEYEVGRPRAAELLEQAEATGFEPLIAEVELARGAIAEAISESEEARAAYEHASLAAFGSGYDLAALRAVIGLTSVVGFALGETRAGRYWGRLGRELVGRLGLEGTIHEAQLHAAIADVEWTATEFDAALAAYERARELAAEALGPEHPEVAEHLGDIGYLYMERGDYDLALRTYDAALALTEAALGPEHPDVAALLQYKAESLRRQGAFEASLEVGGRQIAVVEAAYGPRHVRYARALGAYATSLSYLGRHEEALEYCARALALYGELRGLDSPSYANLLNNRASILAEIGEHERAIADVRRVIEVWIDFHGAGHPNVALARTNLGAMLTEEGQIDEGMAELHAALAQFEAVYEPDHPNIGVVHTFLGQGYIRQGDDEAGRVELLQAVEILGAYPSDPNLHTARLLLGQIHARRGEHEQAMAQIELARAGFEAAGEGMAEKLEDLEAWVAEYEAERDR